MSDPFSKALNAANRVAEVQRLYKAFHQHIANPKRASSIPGKVTANEDEIAVECLGRKLIAIPRVIKDTDDEDWFCTEYDFRTEFTGESISIWRVYLKDGTQPSLHSNDGRICDAYNDHVCQYLLTNISLALLDSIVFERGTGEPVKVL